MDNRAAAEIISRYDSRIRSMARRMSVPGVSVDDLAQEGRIALLRKASQFDPSHPSGTPELWAYAYLEVRSAMRDCVDRESRHLRDRVEISSDIAAPQCPEADMNAKEQRRMFVIAIMELSEEERDLVARRLEGDDIRTIASDLGGSRSATQRAVQRVISNLIAKARGAKAA